MKICIIGGLGFVGARMSMDLMEKGHDITVIDRTPASAAHTPGRMVYVSADTTVPGKWQDAVTDQDAVINLAGASIFRRWRPKTKKLIHDSRIATTRNTADALRHARPGAMLCNTSAVGYYGFCGDDKLTESDAAGGDFLATVCRDWEKEALKAENSGIRVAIARFGIVLDKTGGALGRMIPVFKKFAGGPLGSGEQWFSWIHMDDLINGLMFMVENQGITGPVNLCSPNPVRNKTLAKAVGRALRRPSFFTTPAFMLRLAMGEFGTVLLKGQRVTPEKLIKNGFSFAYPDIDAALNNIIK